MLFITVHQGPKVIPKIVHLHVRVYKKINSDDFPWVVIKQILSLES